MSDQEDDENPNDMESEIKKHLKEIEELKKNDPIYKEQRMKDYAN